MKDKNKLNNIILSKEPDITNPEIIQKVINTMRLDIYYNSLGAINSINSAFNSTTRT
ncbi:hypothetical protein RhiirA4_456510 [Rhizophagus irregularis]|uniref:Uncharacterized protein n=1 Tax=Rhizophagus irregularis TaxID=588596 RepID=A0A2I1G7Q3_9GLOM|nr:hypothetical protein RhiirA4_456510 [Rhizophagus irregularis]